MPLLYETGGEERFDKVVVITAPGSCAGARSRGRDRRAGAAAAPRREKIERADYAYVNTGSLDELDAFVAGVVRDLTAMRRLARLLVVVGVAGRRAASRYVLETSPPWFERLRYPLHY